MKDLNGMVAVITGGGSGIGAAIGRVLAGENMKVVLADIELDAAKAVAEEISKSGAHAVAIYTDVSKKESVEALAERVQAELGGCHLLCANAGVLQIGRLDKRTEEDWQWVLSVNLMGVVRTVMAFLPQMKQHPAEKHIVITTSMAGLLAAGPGKGVYNTSKHAQMAFGETLRAELVDEHIGVSLLLPTGTESRIVESARNRPKELGETKFTDADLEMIMKGVGESVEAMVTADHSVRNLVKGIHDNETWIISGGTQRPLIEKRFNAILDAFDRAVI